jgi:hypothetical protein
MKIKKLSWIYVMSFAVVLNACGTRDANDPGTEYAPQMYVSKAYEPFSQVAGENNKINPDGANMRTPPANTIARRRYKTHFDSSDSTGSGRRDIMAYNIHKDSMTISERVLKNPFKPTAQIMEEGQVLYTRFCAHCHGENGGGNGKVNDQYKGVANISSTGALKNLNGGHIYHVITHGKGRMWAHATLVNPDERWKIVWYVHKLQGQEITPDGIAPKKEEKKEAKEGEKKAEKAEAKAPEKK